VVRRCAGGRRQGRPRWEQAGAAQVVRVVRRGRRQTAATLTELGRSGHGVGAATYGRGARAREEGGQPEEGGAAGGGQGSGGARGSGGAERRAAGGGAEPVGRRGGWELGVVAWCACGWEGESERVDRVIPAAGFAVRRRLCRAVISLPCAFGPLPCAFALCRALAHGKASFIQVSNMEVLTCFT
jgi:hypothetical protein